MNPAEIVAKLKKQFPEIVLEFVEPERGDAYVFVPLDRLIELVSYLKDTWEFSLDHLVSLSAMDTPDHIQVTYHLSSYRHHQTLVFKVKVERMGGSVPSLCGVFGTANFQEREVYDLFGVSFTGHPDLTRIMMPDDWVGHPLLKDYQAPLEYNGISAGRTLPW